MAVDPFPAWLISPLWLIFWRFGLFERRMMGSEASFYFLSQQWLQYCEKMDVVTRERWRSIVAGCKLLHYLTWSAFNVGTEKEKKAGNCRGFFKACGAKAAIVTLASHNNFQIDFPGHFRFLGGKQKLLFLPSPAILALIVFKSLKWIWPWLLRFIYMLLRGQSLE